MLYGIECLTTKDSHLYSTTISLFQHWIHLAMHLEAPGPKEKWQTRDTKAGQADEFRAEAVQFWRVNYSEHGQQTMTCWIITIITLLRWSLVIGWGQRWLLIVLPMYLILLCHLQSTVHDFLADMLLTGPVCLLVLDILKIYFFYQKRLIV